MRVKIDETIGRAVDRVAVLGVKQSKLTEAGEHFHAQQTMDEMMRWEAAMYQAVDSRPGSAVEALRIQMAVESVRHELLLIHRNLWEAEEAKDWQAVRALNVARRELVSRLDKVFSDFSEPYTLGKGGDNAS